MLYTVYDLHFLYVIILCRKFSRYLPTLLCFSLSDSAFRFYGVGMKVLVFWCLNYWLWHIDYEKYGVSLIVSNSMPLVPTTEFLLMFLTCWKLSLPKAIDLLFQYHHHLSPNYQATPIRSLSLQLRVYYVQSSGLYRAFCVMCDVRLIDWPVTPHDVCSGV